MKPPKEFIPLEACCCLLKICCCRKAMTLLDIPERGCSFMLKEMNRREFLKASAITGSLLMSADFLGDSAPLAYGSVEIPEAERIAITSIEDNYYDSLRPDSKIAKRYRGDLYAEHGLACHIETVVDGRSHSLLFDFGRTFHISTCSRLSLTNWKPSH